MSFFEIEPMGARHYGGMPMGGINVGGMMGGARKFGPQASASAQKAFETRLATEELADQLYRADPSLTIRDALDLAQAQLQATRKATPRPRKGEEGYKAPKKHGADWYVSNPMALSTIKKRINTTKKGSILTAKPISKKDIEELSIWLGTKGYGLGDLEGCGFFDSLGHVAKTAMAVAPHILPYFL